MITVLEGQLAGYDTLSPFQEGDGERIVVLQSTIMSGLDEVLRAPGLTEADVTRLTSAPGLMHLASKDSRVRSFSIDEKTGGSFRSNMSLMRYALHDGRVVVEGLGAEGTDDGLYFATFYELYELDSVGHRYLGLANVVTCYTCIATFAVEFVLDTVDVHSNIIQRYDGRMYDLEAFEFDDTTRTLSFSYLEETSEPITDGMSRRRFSGTWRDTGTEFLLTQTCEQVFEVKDH